MAKRRKLPAPPPEADRAAILADALKTSGWKAGGDVMRELIVIPTGCHGLDAITQVGGIPVELITTLYGDSQTGKTALALAICRAFIDAGGIACYIDAEKRLRDHDHVARMLGFVSQDPVSNEWISLPKSEWPNSFWLPPDDKNVYYEDAVEMVTRLASESRRLAAAHDWYPGAVVIVDSLDTLVPEGMLEASLKDFKSAKNKADTSLVKGRGGQRSANVSGEWVKHLVAISASSRLAPVLICQERDKEVNGYSRPYPRGGKAVYFYASLMFRVVRSAVGVEGQYYASRKGTSSDRIIGTRHKVQMRKSSLGNITEIGSKWMETDYFLSNGLGPAPRGVDKARDLLESALNMGVLTQAGSSIKLGEESLGRSYAAVHQRMVQDMVKPESEPSIYRDVLEAFRTRIERDDDFVVQTDEEDE